MEQKQSSRKLKARLFLAVAMITITLFLVNLASAYTISNFQLDTVKQLELKSETNYGTITLKDRYYADLLGWFDKDLAKLTLKDNSDSCGNDCYAIKDIELFEDGSLVDDVRFYRIYEDGKQELSSIRSYEFLIKTDEKVSVEDVYEYQCKETGFINANGTAEMSCSNVKVGEKEVIEDVWGKYNLGDKMPRGTYTLKLVGEKRADWSYDWQILSQGYWSEEWADWSSEGYLFEDDFNGATINTTKWSVYNVGTAPSVESGRLKFASASRTFVYSKINFTGTGFTLQVNGTFCNQGEHFGFGTTLTNFTPYIDGGATNILLDDSGTISGPNTAFLGSNRTLATTNLGFRLTGNHNWTIIQNSSQVTLYQDGVLINTNKGQVTDTGILWIGGNPNCNEYIDWIRFSKAGASITLNSPTNHFNSSSKTITFNATANVVGGATLKNISLYHNYTGTWVRNKTIAMGGSITTNTSTFPTTFASDKVFNWGIQACDSDNDCGWSENRTVSIDTTAPTINLLYPTGIIPYGYVGQNISLNYSIVDTNKQACWYNYNGTTNVTIPCASNSSLILTTAKSILMYANDSAGNLNTTSFSWDYAIFETAQTYSATAYETSIETFYLNLTYNSSATSIIAKLNYDGTNYSSINVGSGDYGSFKATITIPLLSTASNKTFFWYINDIVQERYNQTVNPITVTFCNATYTTRALNFTYYDEDSLLPINGTANNTKIETFFKYWVGDGSIKKEYNFQNLSSTSNTFSFCISPAFVPNINYDLILEYGAIGYLDNEYDVLAGNLSNSTTNVSLYLLPTSLGTKFTHTVREGIDSVPNVLVRVSKFFIGLGTYKEIGIRLTDSTGRFIQYLELDKRYNYTIMSDEGVATSIEMNAICAVAPCEITLQIQGTTTQILDEIEAYIAQNVNYTLWVNKTTKMVYLDFEDLLGTAQYWRLYVYKPYFGNETHDVICNLTSYTPSGSLSCNTTGYSGDIFARVYISRSPEVLVSFLNFLNDDIAPALGDSGLLASIIILLVIIFAGARNPTNALIMIPFGMIILKFIGFMPLPWEAIVGISIVCGIIAFKMKT